MATPSIESRARGLAKTYTNLPDAEQRILGRAYLALEAKHEALREAAITTRAMLRGLLSDDFVMSRIDVSPEIALLDAALDRPSLVLTANERRTS